MEKKRVRELFYWQRGAASELIPILIECFKNFRSEDKVIVGDLLYKFSRPVPGVYRVEVIEDNCPTYAGGRLSYFAFARDAFYGEGATQDEAVVELVGKLLPLSAAAAGRSQYVGSCFLDDPRLTGADDPRWDDYNFALSQRRIKIYSYDASGSKEVIPCP
jgi:hypothetical protein